MDSLWQDLRYGARMLAKRPGITVVAIITLALGIGATTAIFSVVNAVLLRPLPYEDPDKLVIVWSNRLSKGFDWFSPSTADFVDWRDRNTVFDDMAAARNWNVTITGSGEPEQVQGARVSTSFFQMLGAKLTQGRSFTPEEEQPGRDRVVMLSYGFWQRRFGGDTKLVGQTVKLNGEDFAVIGIMPQDFQFAARGFDLWSPLALDSNHIARTDSNILVFARLKPNVAITQAQAEMDAIAERLEQEYPKTNTGRGASVNRMHEFYVNLRNIRPSLLMLLGAVGFLLLIACANIANLQLARAAARQKEIAVRMALGATRSRLVRQLLTESVLLGLSGGATGFLIALWGFASLVKVIPYMPMFRADAMKIDNQAFIFTLAVSLVTGIIFGLVPALEASRPDMNESLKEGARSFAGGTRGRRFRSFIVVAEVAIALVLLAGAGLLVKSFMRLYEVPPGFNAHNAVAMRINLPAKKYAEAQQQTNLYDQLLRRVEALPGVQSIGATNYLPLTVFLTDVTDFTIEGRAAAAGEEPNANDRVINQDYFRAMEINLLRGRYFTESDNLNAQPVVIINQKMADSFWPGEDPIGKRIKPGKADSKDSWHTIVGVVADTKDRSLDVETRPEMYRSRLQHASPDMIIVTRGHSDYESLAAGMRSAVWEVDKDMAITWIAPIEQVVADSTEARQFPMLLLAVFAAVALVLASVGIYGIISHSVAQRTREIGIRIALGAAQRDVLWLVIKQGVRLALAGVAIGLAGAIVLTRIISSLLFGVSATDLWTFAAISILLCAVALLASYIPARKATRVDPMVALRHE